MRRLRFYCENLGKESILDETESHHLSRVLRLQEGDAVEVFDGKGTLAQGVIKRIDRRHVLLQITQVHQTTSPQSGRLILAVSYAKGQRFDWMVEKCTELGANHIAAIQFERTVKLGKENAIDRLKKISLAAAKQCGRLFLPELSGPAGFVQTLSNLRQLFPDASVICGDPDGSPISAIKSEIVKRDIIVLIGPEGGFAPDEIEKIAAEEINRVSVHENILRVETAALAFCSILKSL